MASSTPSTVTAGFLTGLFLLFAGAGLAAAPPAHAVDDPSRPDARVTHGPSCRPGGLVVEVTAGTSPYFVRLATTRQPGGEDQATVTPGATVTLRTADVAWGETIDGRLEYTARDGSDATFIDELEHFSFTRPTEEDCAAASGPTEPHPSPPSYGPSATPSHGSAVPPGAPSPTSGSASARSVAPGDTVTVEATGFLPGERVVVQLRGGAVLGAEIAAADGTVHADVRIPEATPMGPVTVDLVGADSAVVADVDLLVAALARPAGGNDAATLIPLVAAAAALVASAGSLASVAGRRRTGHSAVQGA